MFSYQHRYHAGGFADVHKHICLIALLKAFHKKPTPFCVLDSYAGEGLYDLQCDETQKTHEYLSGFWPMLKHPAYSSSLINDYLRLIRNENKKDEIRYYPGSSALIRSFLREQDRALFVEMHPQAIDALRDNFKGNRNIHVHERDAQEAMVALVPFKEKRGLIFIDPSYEIKSEYQSIPETILQVHKRFTNAVIAIWYPILPLEPHKAMLKQLEGYGFPSTWLTEWSPAISANQQMTGSGMYIINPPWQVDEQIKEALAELSYL